MAGCNCSVCTLLEREDPPAPGEAIQTCDQFTDALGALISRAEENGRGGVALEFDLRSAKRLLHALVMVQAIAVVNQAETQAGLRPLLAPGSRGLN